MCMRHSGAIACSPPSRQQEHRQTTYLIRAICGLNSASVEEKSNRVRRLALSFTEGIHQFLELCRPLDLEEYFVIVVGYFNVEMLRGDGSFGLLAGRGAFVVGHVCWLFFGFFFATVERKAFGDSGNARLNGESGLVGWMRMDAVDLHSGSSESMGGDG